MDDQLIVWRDEFAIGDPTNDAQHRRLILLVAALPEQAFPGDAALLAEMIDYAGRHFHDEEGLMARAGYPGLVAHRDSHKTLTRTLLAYRREFEAGHTDAYHLKQFVFRWIRDHIMDEDVAFGRFLRAKEGGR